jgi:hypothetical protein
MSKHYCPATMCPLIAPNGSPWTGQKNHPCPQRHSHEADDGGCFWYQGYGGTGCDGRSSAKEQVCEMEAEGHTLQAGPIIRKRDHVVLPKTYDCERAAQCQWQIECGAELCPPRLALAKGLDPKVCNW